MTLADGENTQGLATPPAGRTDFVHPAAPATTAPRRLRQLVLHLCRWGLLAAIILLIRQQHVWYQAQTQGQQLAAVTLAALMVVFAFAVLMSLAFLRRRDARVMP